MRYFAFLENCGLNFLWVSSPGLPTLPREKFVTFSHHTCLGQSGKYPISFPEPTCLLVSTKSELRGRTEKVGLRIRSTVTLPTELRGRTEKVGDDLSGESQRRESKGTYECVTA